MSTSGWRPSPCPASSRPTSDLAGLPRPNPTKTARGLGSASSNKREMSAAAMADLPAVLAFYHRELAARGWQEDGSAPLAPGDEVAIKVSNAEETGVLRLGRKYDFTMVSLNVQVKESALAARAKAKKEADDKFLQRCGGCGQAAHRRRRSAAQGAGGRAVRRAAQCARRQQDAGAAARDRRGREVRRRATAGSNSPPTSSVKALTTFYRASLKSAGWKEQPSVINQPNMAVMEFSKGGKSISMTVMQMGPKVNVRADRLGPRWLASGPKHSRQIGRQQRMQAKSSEPLKPDPESATARADAALIDARSPPRKCRAATTSFRTRARSQHSGPARRMSSPSIARSSPSSAGRKRPTARPCPQKRAQIAFTSPEGPAMLKLGRAKGETTVNLVQRNPDAAAKADIMPKAGQARLMLGNIGPEGSLADDQQADGQDRGRRRRPEIAERPDARPAARQVQYRCACLGPPPAPEPPHRGRRAMPGAAW